MKTNGYALPDKIYDIGKKILLVVEFLAAWSWHCIMLTNGKLRFYSCSLEFTCNALA
jgi:hypothetical protein